MKKLSILLMGIAFSTGFAQQTITHSNDTTTVLSPHAVTCGTQGVHTSFNEFSRSFVLADFGITDDFNVTSVGFGVENITGDLPFIVRLSTTDDDYPWGNLTELHNETVTMTPADALTVIEHTFAAPVNVPAGSELVFSFEADGEPVGISWYPASNDAGETAFSYIRAEACGITEPSTMASIGDFGDVHIIMTITGETSMGTVELNSRALSVYPNPTTDMINIALKNGETVESIEIVNLAGQSVFASKATNSANVAFLPAGVYVVKAKDNKGVTHVSKIIKK